MLLPLIRTISFKDNSNEGLQHTFYGEIWKTIPKLNLLPLLISSTGIFGNVSKVVCIMVNSANPDQTAPKGSRIFLTKQCVPLRSSMIRVHYLARSIHTNI